MTRSAYSLLAGVLCYAFYGCTDGKNNETDPINGFTQDKHFIHTDYAVRKEWSGGTQIAFTDMHPAASASGNVHAVQFLLDTLRDSGTYTYMSSDAVAYDKTKNFDVALLLKNVAYKSGAEVTGTGEIFSKPTGGSLTFINGPEYQAFTYTLDFGRGNTLSGFFRGQLTVVE
ncbi:hypothetical protein [Chitinophaga rhizophila]|uniref:Uncharacterized protein n=1 Tax=Chitinophaga rhizophila TaxID=2866212 RepID=A0ABS7G834_9BACT|nr:hypothetical protein [Chitinophaga rhizophila]MBW8683832.1 hypothetical protein [Chitinophaga rhizophila]